MARTLQTIAGSKRQSIAEIQIRTSAATLPQDWNIRYIFEDGIYDQTGALVAPPVFATRAHDRSFADVKDRAFTATVNGKSISATGEQISALLRVAGYAILEEELAAEAAHEAAVALNAQRKIEAEGAQA
jgi:hypothetical protein